MLSLKLTGDNRKSETTGVSIFLFNPNQFNLKNQFGFNHKHSTTEK